MKHPHAFLMAVSAGLTAGCAAGAVALAPVGDNVTSRAAAPAFAFLATMATASAAITWTAAADAIAARADRRA